MTLTDAMARIESLEFDVLVNVASDFQTFLLAAQQEEAVWFLYRALKKQENCRRLLSRIMVIRDRDIDERYVNPGDTALTVYLWGIHLHDWELAKLAAVIVLEARQCWWARRLAQHILLEQPTFSHAEDTTSENSVGQPQDTVDISALGAGPTVSLNVSFLANAGEILDVQRMGLDGGTTSAFVESDRKESQVTQTG